MKKIILQAHWCYKIYTQVDLHFIYWEHMPLHAERNYVWSFQEKKKLLPLYWPLKSNNLWIMSTYFALTKTLSWIRYCIRVK